MTSERDHHEEPGPITCVTQRIFIVGHSHSFLGAAVLIYTAPLKEGRKERGRAWWGRRVLWVSVAPAARRVKAENVL